MSKTPQTTALEALQGASADQERARWENRPDEFDAAYAARAAKREDAEAAGADSGDVRRAEDTGRMAAMRQRSGK